jgi:hypothetical protein
VPVAAAAAVGPNQAAGQGDQNEINPGGFVANDSIDEGVKLLAKLQHGAVLDALTAVSCQGDLRCTLSSRWPFCHWFR